MNKTNRINLFPYEWYLSDLPLFGYDVTVSIYGLNDVGAELGYKLAGFKVLSTVKPKTDILHINSLFCTNEHNILVYDLQPKVVVVPLFSGKDVETLLQIAGYDTQVFGLQYHMMGVPSYGVHYVILGLRNDLANPKMQQVSLFERHAPIDMTFKEPVIPYMDFADYRGRNIPKAAKEIWDKRLHSDFGFADTMNRCGGSDKYLGFKYAYPENPLNEIKVLSNGKALRGHNVAYNNPCFLSDREIMLGKTFPLDYDFNGMDVLECCGRSMPPVAVAQMASRIKKYWL